MAAHLRLIPHAAQADALEGPPQRLCNRRTVLAIIIDGLLFTLKQAMQQFYLCISASE